MSLTSCSADRSKQGRGMYVIGAGSKATAKDCTFTGNMVSNVKIDAQAMAVFSRCALCMSEGQGLVVEGAGSRATAKDSNFERNQHCNVFVADGGMAMLSGCSMRQSSESSGLQVYGQGSRAIARLCDFSLNAGFGASALDGGSVDLGLCTVARNEHLAHAVFCLGAGSRLLLSRNTVLDKSPGSLAGGQVSMS